LIKRTFGEIFVGSSKLQTLLCKSTKFVLEFCGLDPLGILALVDIATLSCFNRDFLRISTRAPCPFARTILSRKTFRELALRKKFWNNATDIHLTAIAITYHDGNSGYNSLLSRAFSVGIPSCMGF
jgi:hypothetical protein